MASKFTSVPPVAAEILGRATVQGNVIILPPGNLDRLVYDAINKVMTAMGGKWNKKAGGHLFAFDPSEMLAEALCTGKTVNRKQTLQFFETPAEMAERVVGLAQIMAGDLVLEPSAGHGRLVKPALAKGAEVIAVEIDTTNADILSRIGGFEVNQDNFLEWAPRERRRFDAVVMNPPFTGNQDIRHIQAAWNLLRDGGRMVAILGEHAFIGREAECVEFRSWIGRIGAVVEMVAAGAFKESGTNMAVRLITATKATAVAVAA